jgi:hypothetical protein
MVRVQASLKEKRPIFWLKRTHQLERKDTGISTLPMIRIRGWCGAMERDQASLKEKRPIFWLKRTHQGASLTGGEGHGYQYEGNISKDSELISKGYVLSISNES